MVTYFGQENENQIVHANNCDVLVNTVKKPSQYGPHWQVEYDWEYNGYVMKDLNRGSLVHYTLQEIMKIPHRMTLCCGNTVLMLRSRSVIPGKSTDRSIVTQSIFSNFEKKNTLINDVCKSEKCGDPGHFQLTITNLSRTEVGQANQYIYFFFLLLYI